MLVSIENVKTLVRLSIVVLMQNVVQETTNRNVPAYLITLEIHMTDVEDLSVLLIQIVPQLSLVEMKSVLIHVIVHSMQIVPREIIEEFVFVDLVIQEIHME